MFNNRDGGFIAIRGVSKFRYEFIGCVCVVDIIIREGFALQLLGCGDARAIGAVGVKGGCLVRVFAVAQFLF